MGLVVLCRLAHENAAKCFRHKLLPGAQCADSARTFQPTNLRAVSAFETLWAACAVGGRSWRQFCRPWLVRGFMWAFPLESLPSCHLVVRPAGTTVKEPRALP